MAEIKWIKLYVEMFDNRKIKFIRKLPEGNDILLCWIMLMASAGKCNTGGYIFLTENVPYTPEMLSNEYEIPLSTIQLALETFKRLNMVNTDIDGCIYLPNWEEYQNVDRMSELKEYNRLAKQKERKKQKLLKSVNDMSMTLQEGKMDSVNDASIRSRRCQDIDIELDKDLDINNNINAREEEEIVSERSRDANETPQTVNELNETVSKTEKVHSRDVGTQAIDWAEKNWGRLIPKGETDSILAWCDEFSSRGSPDPDGVVIEGLRCCLNADVRNMFYLRRVLTDWREAGVLTVADVETRELERKGQKAHKRNKDPDDKPPKPPKPPGGASKYEKFYL
jgi:predicted phage replisome organizer